MAIFNDDDMAMLEEIDDLHLMEESISVVRGDPTPADVSTYCPEYAFYENWHPGRKFRIVSEIEGIMNPELLGFETECEFVWQHNEYGNFWIFYRAPDGRRVRANWSDVLPLTERNPEQPRTLPAEADSANWTKGTVARYIAHHSGDTSDLYPSPTEELKVVDWRKFAVNLCVYVVDGEGKKKDLTIGMNLK